MSDNPSTRWNLLIHVAQQSLDERGRHLAQLCTRRDDAAARLQTLLDYRISFREQRTQAEQNGLTADKLRNHQSFAATLERAVEEQSDRLNAVQRLVHDCESDVRELHRRIHSFGVLQARQARSARVLELRVEQKHDDEIASRMRLAS